jgi:hypothetical protein
MSLRRHESSREAGALLFSREGFEIVMTKRETAYSRNVDATRDAIAAQREELSIANLRAGMDAAAAGV